MLTNTIDLNELFPDPDEVGTSEYLAIINYLDGMEDFPAVGVDDEDADAVTIEDAEALLDTLVCLEEEVSSRCASLRQAIKEARRS